MKSHRFLTALTLALGLPLVLWWVLGLATPASLAAGSQPVAESRTSCQTCYLPPEVKEAAESANLPLRQATAITTLVASQDTTLYRDFPDNGNGAGTRLVVGLRGNANNPVNPPSPRRGAIMFNLAGSGIPAGANVLSVTLLLTQALNTNLTGKAVTVTLYKLNESWTEGTINAVDEAVGEPETAASGGATWEYRSFSTSSWLTDGGTFSPIPRASTLITEANQLYRWSTPEMADDVESWLANPAQNFGWILVSAEDQINLAPSLALFHSRNVSAAADRPTLIVEYETVPTPALAVSKTANVTVTQPGQTVTYTYRVTNTGNVNLTAISANDDHLGFFFLSSLSLAPNEVATRTLPYVVQESDLPGPLVNNVQVVGTYILTTVTANASASVNLADLDISKTPDRTTANLDDTIAYTYRITNTGNTTLSGLNARDISLAGSSIITLSTTTLPPGSVAVGSLTHTVVITDLPGPLTNTVIATGTSSAGTPVTDTANAAVTLNFEPPALVVTKTANVNVATVGQAITYDYEIRNTGDVVLMNVNARDDRLGNITLSNDIVFPNQVATGTLTYIVQPGDLPGPLQNTVVATGTPARIVIIFFPVFDIIFLPDGPPLSTSDTTTVPLADWEVAKIPNVTTAGVGQTITYTYLVTNTGGTILENLTARDNSLGLAVTFDSSTLPSGEVTSGTLTYTVQTTDLPGPLINTATFTSTPAGGEEMTETAAAAVDLGALAVTKTPEISLATVGQTITYTYFVTNTGNITLTNLNASDNPLGSLDLGTTTLAPGAVASGTLTYTVQTTDLPGPLINTVIITGVSDSGAEITTTTSASVDLGSLTITKLPDVDTAGISQTITYLYLVTNTGSIPLTNINAIDDRLGNLTLSSLTLAPGAVASGTLTYTVQTSDFPGPLTNTVTITGVSTGGVEITTTATATVNLAILVIVKTPNVDTAGVGQTIIYTYRITNTGSSVVNNLSARDNRLSQPVNFGSATLAPQGVTSGSLTYTIQATDLPGPLINTVIATGTSASNAILTTTADALVNLAALSVSKVAAVSTAEVGQTITYTYRVTNIGSINLAGIDSYDDKLGPFTLGAPTLAVAEVTNRFLTYTVITSDLPGPLVNQVTITGVAPSGLVVTKAVSASVTLAGQPTDSYLPLILKDFSFMSDLVGSFSLSPNQTSFAAGAPVQITVVVTNQGTATAGPFWVDFYINPNPPPAGANQPWDQLCGLTPCYGLAWYVPTSLAPGQSISLTSDPTSYFAPNTVWPGFFASGSSDLYLFVDSWNPDVATGGVAESDETNNRAELHGLTVSGLTPATLNLPSAADLPPRPVRPEP